MKISRNVIFAALVSATIFAGCASTKQKVVSVVAPIISSEDLRLALEPEISSDGLSAENIIFWLLTETARPLTELPATNSAHITKRDELALHRIFQKPPLIT